MLIHLAHRFFQLLSPSKNNRRGRRVVASRMEAWVETLEPRQMLSGNALVVNTLNDTDQTGTITLRDAINKANTDSPGDTITFASNLSGGTITLSQGLLNINNSMSITGLGENELTISGNNLSGVFGISNGTVTISGLTLIDGNANNGGGINNSGTLTAHDDAILGCSANSGGGIFNQGTLVTQNDNISGNTAQYGGGIFNQSLDALTSTDDTLSSNTVTRVGGGIDNLGTLTLTGATVSYNSSSQKGGGIFNFGTITSSQDEINNNTANIGSGSEYAGGGGIDNEGTWQSSSDTVNYNVAMGNGGGVFNDNVFDCLFDQISFNKSQQSGGGVYNTTNINSVNVTFDLMNSSISNNSSNNFGGGIYVDGSVICDSSNNTIANNTAPNGGGGIRNAGILQSTNDTIANNAAAVGAGGGILDNGAFTSRNDTIANNSSGGGVFVYGSWNSINTIVAGNVGSDITSNSSLASVYNTLIGDNSSGLTNGIQGNVIGAVTSSIFVTDGKGNPILANNGGSTQTIALIAGSPAIGAGGSLATLTQGIGSGNGTLILTPPKSATFASVGDFLRIDSEIMKVTGIGANTISVLRGRRPLWTMQRVICGR